MSNYRGKFILPDSNQEPKIKPKIQKNKQWKKKKHQENKNEKKQRNKSKRDTKEGWKYPNLIVYIDTSENKVIEPTFNYLNSRRIRCEKKNLAVADFAFFVEFTEESIEKRNPSDHNPSYDRFCVDLIERKTYADLNSSILPGDNRYKTQQFHMYQSRVPCKSFWVIGDPPLRNGHFNHESLKRCHSALCHNKFFGINTLQIPNLDEMHRLLEKECEYLERHGYLSQDYSFYNGITEDILTEIWKTEVSQNENTIDTHTTTPSSSPMLSNFESPVVPVREVDLLKKINKKKSMTNNLLYYTVLTNIPLIQDKTANSVMERYPTFNSLYTALTKNGIVSLNDIHGLGENRKDNIFKFITNF